MLVVAGDGPLRARLERAARRKGLPVTFAGFITDPTELAALLASADVVIAPGPVETFGLAALEALACGTPVVVSADSALPEVIGAAGVAVGGRGLRRRRRARSRCDPPASAARGRGRAPRTSAGPPRPRRSWPSHEALEEKVERMTRIVTLGDSITIGMGDPAPEGPQGGWRGWARLLADGLPDPELHNLAVLGAQAKHVERDQLPAALALRPDIATRRRRHQRHAAGRVRPGAHRPGVRPDRRRAARQRRCGAHHAAA